VAKKNDLREIFGKGLRAVDMTLRLKPYKKSLSAAINEKVARRRLGKM
jgi:hypothetical protein